MNPTSLHSLHPVHAATHPAARLSPPPKPAEEPAPTVEDVHEALDREAEDEDEDEPDTE